MKKKEIKSLIEKLLCKLNSHKYSLKRIEDIEDITGLANSIDTYILRCERCKETHIIDIWKYGAHKYTLPKGVYDWIFDDPCFYDGTDGKCLVYSKEGSHKDGNKIMVHYFKT